MSARVARVVIDSPLPQLDHLFDYAIPAELDGVVPGVRVRVPLRSAGRVADAFVVEVVDDSEHQGSLSPLETLVSEVPVLSPEVWHVARAVADRAAGSASDVLRLAVPKRQVRVEKAYVAAGAPGVPAGGAMHAPLEGYAGSGLDEGIADGGRFAVDAVPGLVPVGDGSIGAWAATAARLAVNTSSRGRQSLIAVPDHRDLDQLEAALGQLGAGDLVLRLDAAQPPASRYRAFLSALGDGPHIVIGNRSALLAPASRLGLILVWDDGDPLHREPLAPYAHVRDVALIRQSQSDASLVLLSHARSVDAQRLVEMEWLASVSPSPVVRPRVVLAEDPPGEASARIPATAWKLAREALASGPVLVQVARPGYAPVVACGSCGTAATCARCHGPLGVARRGAQPQCGVCGAVAAPWTCDVCSGGALRLVSRGSGRTAEELGRAFPGSRVVVADGEHRVLTVPASPSLVVATRGAEPIATGGYAAVLLLDGERMLARESLTIAEDAMRWWSNAAALAAPRAPVVLAGVSGGLAQAFAAGNHVLFASRELADRRTLGFPPAVRTATVTGPADAVGTAVDALADVAVRDILGPIPVETGGVRSVVRFDYRAGADVARELRSALIRNATTRRRPVAGRPQRAAPSLRLHFDDPEVWT
ncbi:replication restart DNA helicase PriA [Labedella gwakjiensis]|uniref:Probable replication restart protein PriA n=1 Tax=Labedella gwakjiensis TaxID=390269 RepID=A0A2P8GZV7_9MICO|nr:preprotein translocase subunit SecA [Labedella gwakjiensis]PSL39488.1 replication restart DNA helicase PriA [Labedella gwakjiensis]RUQ86112.1 primosomal protein N' [Labedella gwakjiensis]